MLNLHNLLASQFCTSFLYLVPIICTCNFVKNLDIRYINSTISNSYELFVYLIYYLWGRSLPSIFKTLLFPWPTLIDVCYIFFSNQFNFLSLSFIFITMSLHFPILLTFFRNPIHSVEVHRNHINLWDLFSLPKLWEKKRQWRSLYSTVSFTTSLLLSNWFKLLLIVGHQILRVFGVRVLSSFDMVLNSISLIHYLFRVYIDLFLRYNVSFCF